MIIGPALGARIAIFVTEKAIQDDVDVSFLCDGRSPDRGLLGIATAGPDGGVVVETMRCASVTHAWKGTPEYGLLTSSGGNVQRLLS